MIDIVVKDNATPRLLKMKQGAEKLGSIRILVGSNLKYAYGIEYGRHRNGGLARRAGGAMMLNKALESIRTSLPRDIAAAIDNDTSVYDAVFRNALRAENVAKSFTPVKTGSLRRSFHTVSKGR